MHAPFLRQCMPFPHILFLAQFLLPYRGIFELCPLIRSETKPTDGYSALVGGKMIFVKIIQRYL